MIPDQIAELKDKGLREIAVFALLSELYGKVEEARPILDNFSKRNK